MNISKVLLYCLWWFLFAGMFTFLGAMLVYMWENRTSNQNHKELIDWWVVNDSDTIWEKTVPHVIPSYLGDENTLKDVPQVTLRADSTTVKVWDTVTFKAISKILSDNADFEKNRMFYYDFDWNWTWDLVTKQDEIKYTYIDSYEEGVTPRVAVEYEWQLGQAKWETLLVVNWWILLDSEKGINEEYERNKAEILALVQSKWARLIIERMFNDVEKNLSDYLPENRAKELENIRDTIIRDVKEIRGDETFYTEYFCNIFENFSISEYTDKCQTL